MYDGPPVVVVGNGPVGQTTALLLARWGVPTIVLDAQDRRTPVGSRSICQQRETLDIWDSVGAGREIADEGVTWRVARTYYREHELFHLAFADSGSSPFPPWVNIGQARVEQLLDERIAEQPLIEARWGTTVTGITQDRDRARVETTHGSIATPYVVACAGAHGDVARRAVGAEFEGRSFADRFLICDIRCELPDRELERRFYFDPAWNPGRQVLMHPCPDSTYRIDWQVAPEFDLEQERASGDLDRRIRRIVGDRDHEVVWCTVYRFHSRCATTMGAGRVLLAGDCAHLVAPFGARGLNSGVADAENAAWRIAFELHGWGRGLTPAYDVERRAAAQDNLAVTTRTMDFLVPQSDAGWAHRCAVLERAVTDPEARTQIDSGRLYAPFRYGDHPHPAVGAILPDHAVDGVRLRELARRGLLLLSRDPVQVPDLPFPCSAVALPTGPADELGLTAGEAWVVRPDAHVAAAPAPGALGEAVGSLLAGPGLSQ
ncbi:FAD-dependent monooxygenase [Nocardioides sp.]|uniref:FAD-dependent monooxygenase n=1 Tax=Nocardioides sp. TaxID=35761 RepID=UPI0026232950|nr:FAD-dependent monooxygenase [Nocardioides sp.]MDI6909391.1 FAD-dependent monooxygenase [Nocardioides sp.]